MRRSILPVKDFRTYRRLVRLLRELKPDVVHTHSSKAGIIGRWAADRAKVPAIVHTIHGLAFTASTSRAVNSVYPALERRTAPITTRIVCVAGAMREQALARALPQGSLARKPVVAYDVDGNREGVVDGKTGFVLPPFDKGKLADALRTLVSGASLRESMGEAGRAFALARFDARVMVDALE